MANIGIVGSRDKYFENAFTKTIWKGWVFTAVSLLPDNSVIINGKSPGYGVDEWAEMAARGRGLKIELEPIPHDPAYTKFTFAEAAKARNRRLVSRSDVIIAFQKNGSSGTAHAISMAKQFKKPCWVIRDAYDFVNFCTSFVGEPTLEGLNAAIDNHDFLQALKN